MRHCKTCNRKFNPIHKRHWYCSKNCWNKNPKHQEYKRKYQSTQRYKEYARQYYVKHKKEKAAYYKKRWQSKAYKQSARKSRLKRQYNLSLEDYHKLLKKQRNRCAICRKHETKKDRYGNIKNLQVDHNHKTKKIRGLLCFSCNALLGLSYSDVKILQNAINYLKNK